MKLSDLKINSSEGPNFHSRFCIKTWLHNLFLLDFGKLSSWKHCMPRELLIENANRAFPMLNVLWQWSLIPWELLVTSAVLPKSHLVNNTIFNLHKGHHRTSKWQKLSKLASVHRITLITKIHNLEELLESYCWIHFWSTHQMVFPHAFSICPSHIHS